MESDCDIGFSFLTLDASICWESSEGLNSFHLLSDGFDAPGLEFSDTFRSVKLPISMGRG